LSDFTAPVPKKKLWDFVNEELFDKLHARKLPNGNCAYFDPVSGKDLIILHRFRDKDEMVELLFDELDTPFGKVFFGPETKHQHATERGIYYSSQWADLFCAHIYDGVSLTELCARQNMPTFETVYKWRKRYPDFEEKFQAAYEARGERLRDEVYQNSKQMVNEDTPEVYAQRKAHIENLKWLASKDNPKRFSAHVEVHQTNAPVQIVLDTGVRIPRDLPDELRSVKEITGENVEHALKVLDEHKNEE